MSVSLRAFVAGYTGKLGQQLIKCLVNDTRYASVQLLGRRKPDIDFGAMYSNASEKLTQHVVDFNQLDDYQMILMENDIGFSLLPIISAKEGIMSRDRNKEVSYVAQLAELSLLSGCREFHVVSCENFTLELEQEVESVGVFPNYLAFYRPSRSVSKQMSSSTTSHNCSSISTSILAQALANAPFELVPTVRRLRSNCINLDLDSRVYLVENEAIFKLATIE